MFNPTVNIDNVKKKNAIRSVRCGCDGAFIIKRGVWHQVDFLSFQSTEKEKNMIEKRVYSGQRAAHDMTDRKDVYEKKMIHQIILAEVCKLKMR